LLDSATNWQ